MADPPEQAVEDAFKIYAESGDYDSDLDYKTFPELIRKATFAEWATGDVNQAIRHVPLGYDECQALYVERKRLYKRRYDAPMAVERKWWQHYHVQDAELKVGMDEWKKAGKSRLSLESEEPEEPEDVGRIGVIEVPFAVEIPVAGAVGGGA